MANKGINFLIGFLTGVITGAAIGLLMAPEPGEETRKLIKEKLDEYADQGKNIVDDLKSKLQKG